MVSWRRGERTGVQGAGRGPLGHSQIRSARARKRCTTLRRPGRPRPSIAFGARKRTWHAGCDGAARMKVAFALLIGLHGLIHLMGFAKAFGYAELPRLTTPISRAAGVVWLVAALAHVAAALMLGTSSERWWWIAIVAIVASQLAIVGAWTDAKLGTLINVAMAVPVALSLLALRNESLRSVYKREVAAGLARAPRPPIVTEADLLQLPPLVQTYARRVGILGKPRVHNIRVRWHGHMRASPDAGWMKSRIEQYEFFDPATRLFFMEASRYGIPFEGLHIYQGPSATMRVRAMQLLDLVDARGPEMDRSETVTLFNDMCLLAPASLLGAAIDWQTLDEHRVRGVFTNAGHTVSAELTFDKDGDLVNFLSHDRDQSTDGKTYRRYPWSTPMSDYRDYHGMRLASRGEAIWHEPTGPFVYGRLELEDIVFNVGTDGQSRP